MSDPKTYEQAMAGPSSKIWPGCGDGRCMPCGAVHDFSYRSSRSWSGDPKEGIQHNFCCKQNHFSGCPHPIPEPEHKWVNGRCEKCGRRAGWMCQSGTRYRDVAHARRYGVSRQHLISEENEELLEMLANDSQGG